MSSDASGYAVAQSIVAHKDMSKFGEATVVDSQTHGHATDSVVPWPWYRKESSKHQGKFYYVNSVTQETVWKAPSIPETGSTLPSTPASETAGESNRCDTEVSQICAAGKTTESVHSEGEPEKETPPSLPETGSTLPSTCASSEKDGGGESERSDTEASQTRAAGNSSASEHSEGEPEKEAPPGAAPSIAESGLRSSGAGTRSKPSRPQCVQADSVGSSSRFGSAKQSSRLEVSSESPKTWAAQQRLRRGLTCPDSEADEDVTRRVKSILNKLTIENFSKMSKQLLYCRFTCVDHVHILIEEIFEKATAQHQYIEMYSELCKLLHAFFSENPVSKEAKHGFKRLLLDECQRSFERNLEPPSNLHQLDREERTLAEIQYKTKTLGNIRFVGALLAKDMLVSKVLVAIVDQLMTDPSPEALESLVALLTATGPVFDTSEWQYHPKLVAVFSSLSEIVVEGKCSARVRCLLQDLLDLRAADWQDGRPKKTEAPTTLKAVAEMAKQAEKTVKPIPYWKR